MVIFVFLKVVPHRVVWVGSGSRIVGGVVCNSGKQFILFFRFSQFVESIVRLFEFIAVECKCVEIVWGQVFWEGADDVAVVLDGTLKVSFLWGLRRMVVGGVVGSRLSRYIVRSVGIYFSEDRLCRMLKNVRKRSIGSVVEYITMIQI